MRIIIPAFDLQIKDGINWQIIFFDVKLEV